MWLRSRFKQLTWVILVILLNGSSLTQAQSPELPAGPAQEKVRTACTECHDAHIIRQQRLSSKAWSKEVDKMIKWGAVVDLADRNAFIDYLSIYFPPDKAAEPAERAGPGKKK